MEKTFDCVKMKNELQAKIYEDIKNMTAAEELEYFRKRANESAWWRSLGKPINAPQSWTPAAVPAK